MIIICKNCGKEFDGHHLRKYCDECRPHVLRQQKREQSKRLYSIHREKKLEYYRQYRLRNLERQRERCRLYDETHREQRRQKARLYREQNRELLNDRERKRYWANRDKILAQKSVTMARYYVRHKARISIKRKLKKIDRMIKVKPFCHTCGKTFKPSYKGEKYCSQTCRQQSPLYRILLRIQARCGY